MMMASGGLVYPQELEVVMDVVSSPVLAAATRVNDANTCGVAVAEVFNIMQVSNLVINKFYQFIYLSV